MNNKKWLTIILPLLFFICFVGVLISAAAARPRVLVVMSYSPQDLWEQHIKSGIDQTFQKNAPYFLVDYFYLDIRDNYYPAYIERITKNIYDLIAAWHPQVLILVDDDAQLYVGVNYLNKPGMDLVFTGVNANPDIYGYAPHKNVTGIRENLHFEAMQAAIKAMFPKYTKIIHLCDNSRTSQIIVPQIKANNWRRLQFLGSYPTNFLSDWLAVVKKANAEHALLLLTHLQTVNDDKGEPIEPTKLMQLTLQQAHVPILGFFNFDVTFGAPMAISTSGFEQGQVAANLAMQILLDKKNPGNIPFAKSQYFDFSVNQNSIAINMPNVKIPLIYRSLAYLMASDSH